MKMPSTIGPVHFVGIQYRCHCGHHVLLELLSGGLAIAGCGRHSKAAHFDQTGAQGIEFIQ